MSRNTSFVEKYGPWALVTGASAGIGAEFAEQLTAQGLNVVLVARREAKLKSLANSLELMHGVKTRIIAADLTDPTFIEAIRAQTSDIEVGLLVNNAGQYYIGKFLDQPLETQLSVLAVNTRAPLVLTHEFGQKMRQRGKGGIIMVSSTVSSSGAPYNANYAATKAYDLILGEGLQHELKSDGVAVQVLQPGGTWTEGAQKMMVDAPGYMKNMMMDTEPVVTISLRNLGKRTMVIPGSMNRFMTWMMSNLLPRRVAVSMWGKMMQGMQGQS